VRGRAAVDRERLVLLVAAGAGVLAAGTAFVTAGLCRMRRRSESEQQDERGKNRTQHWFSPLSEKGWVTKDVQRGGGSGGPG